MLSHISTVSAVRTARALVRANSMQLRMLDEIALVESEIGDDIGFVGGFEMVEKGLVGARGDQHALPFVLRRGIGLGQSRDAAGGFDQAGEEVGALQIARDPVRDCRRCARA